MKINVQLDFKTIQARSAKPVHLVIELGAARLETQRTEPIAFCVVLDRSNSMDGEPIRNAREACKLLVRNLRANDLFSLVTFSDSAQVVIPMGTVKNLDKVLASIDQIQARGYTNLTGGWSGAGEELELTPKNVKRRLLLLTDGQANVGITNPAIIQNVVSLGAHGQNIRTSTIGFGLEYQEELLSEMATVSSGQFTMRIRQKSWLASSRKNWKDCKPSCPKTFVFS